jgi:hypothetical protein
VLFLPHQIEQLGHQVQLFAQAAHRAGRWHGLSSAGVSGASL